MSSTPHVALFDMDRTLVEVHTARLYLRLQRELGEIGWLELLRNSYWLLQYGFGLIQAERVAPGAALQLSRHARGVAA